MRIVIPLALFCLACLPEAGAQNQSASSAKPFGPLLVVESGLHADGGDPVVEAGEHARVRAIISNRGSMNGSGITLLMHPQGEPVGITLSGAQQVGTLAVGESREVVVEFVVGDSVPSQELTFLLQAHEPSGRVHPVDTLHFATARSTLPVFQFTWGLDHPDAGSLEAVAPGDTVFLVLRLHNTGGAATDVSLHFEERVGIRPLDWADTLLVVGDLAAGDSVLHRILVRIDEMAQGDTARAGVALLERRTALTRRWEISCPLADNARLLVRRGAFAFERGKPEAALAHYSEAIKLDPSLAQAHLLQGLVYEYLGDKKRCLRAIRRASELGDSIATAWLREHDQVRGPKVKYVRLQPDPFHDAQRGAGLAVLPFDRETGSDVADRVYRKLASNSKARGRFTLYSAASLAEQQEALGLSSLDPESEDVRHALRAVDIQYILTGAVAEESPLSIILRCVRTDDGATLVEQELRESNVSTALDDAVRLIAEGRKPVYRKR